MEVLTQGIEKTFCGPPELEKCPPAARKRTQRGDIKVPKCNPAAQKRLHVLKDAGLPLCKNNSFHWFKRNRGYQVAARGSKSDVGANLFPLQARATHAPWHG